jgi:hypothetical protein
MSNHEYFKKMSALSAIGQISAQEDQELAEHLNECVSCRDIYFDYARVVRQELPQADPIRWRIKSALPASRRDPEVRARFLARARADGIDFSLDAERSNGAKSNPSWRASRLWPALAVAPALVLAVLVLWVGGRYEFVPRLARTGIDPRSAQLAHENDDLRAQLAALRQTVEHDAATIGEMKKGSAGSLESQQKLQKQLDESWQQAAKLSDNLHRTEAEKDEMVRASQAEGATIGSLRAQSESLSHERAEMLNSRAILEAQVRNLTASLEEKTADLERERQLMAVSKDVRQLMGARNLHIMDVHDMGGGRKDVRAFGRVFYAEGQSLIFYAFDLPNGKLSPAKYTFQAWGQREAASQSARNLGTFQVDDHEQRRWVLKVTDTGLLTGIDSVFVTAESLDVAKSPSGKKLLYAYIAGQPNHP